MMDRYIKILFDGFNHHLCPTKRMGMIDFIMVPLSHDFHISISRNTREGGFSCGRVQRCYHDGVGAKIGFATRVIGDP